ncbi:unnamed protein product [Effrenium voratum]|nr:unnamed protein product [Effrenium voratum]
MCYSLAASLTALAVGVGSSASAYALSQWENCYLLAAVSLVQLGEAFIWLGLDAGMRWPNCLGTAIVQASLPTHFLALCLGARRAGAFPSQVPLRDLGWASWAAGWFVYAVYARPVVGGLSAPLKNACNARLTWPLPLLWYFLVVFWPSLALTLRRPYIPWPYSVAKVGLAVLCYCVARGWSAFPQPLASEWCLVAAVAGPLLVAGEWCQDLETWRFIPVSHPVLKDSARFRVRPFVRNFTLKTYRS